ncbi:transcription termination factor Rho [Luteolibacter flavescens]|uniref:Transcription termination factor Rho n=1 Tax=Luteolibacter flavescens TaxID=1859460 RepID=A0ABT3FSL6_9BACT|nr:transcription termination factor Rho [Luteolibacter flavescens]MCW1886560.1 transcription termination factor Rho [Luteolibacter flavescens]
MSEHTTQDTAGYEPASEVSPPAAAKPAKKAAKKAAAKKTAAKKTAAKKTAAKKSAKTAEADAFQAVLPLDEAPAAKPKAVKTAKKAAKKKVAAVEESFAIAEPAPAAAPAPAAEEKPAARKRSSKAAPAPAPAAEAAPAPAEVSYSPAEASSSDSKPVTFGRVPGGGPVHREDRERQQQQQGHPQQQQPRPEGGGDRSDANRERRKRRRKRRRERERESRQGSPQGGEQGERPPQGERQPAAEKQKKQHAEPVERPPAFSGPRVEVNGMLELAPKGFGFLRVPSKNFEQARDDVFVSPEMVRRHGLRPGVWIHGIAQEGSRGQQLVELTTINDVSPDEAKKFPSFEELKAVNPSKRISFETTPERYTTRVLDLMAPVGRGQRGLIVSPPRSGKTTLLLHIAEAVRELHDETLHLIVLLVDERPEEVTEFRRTLPGAEIYASSNDEGARSHCRIAEMCIERAKRLVEGGKHVFLLMDSITRLARAYNGNSGGGRGRGIGSGGVTVGALEVPRRLFAAARNTRDAGSLTILATALIQTNSRADEVIFQEFKGTGNMELVLDRKIAENYIYPAVDIFKSGTRREELLLPEHMLQKIHLIRRGLSGHRPVEAMERLIYFLKKFPNNPQMLLGIKGTSGE